MKKKFLLLSALFIIHISNVATAVTKEEFEMGLSKMKADLNEARQQLDSTIKEQSAAFRMFEETQQEPLRELLDQNLKSRALEMVEFSESNPTEDEAIQKVLYDYAGREVRLGVAGLIKSIIQHYEEILKDENNPVKSCDKQLGLLALLHVEDTIDYAKSNAAELFDSKTKDKSSASGNK